MAALALTLLAGCGASARPAPGALQRFDEERWTLATVTEESGSLATGSSSLAGAVARADAGSVKAGAVAWKRAAADLMASSGSAAYTTSRILAHQRPGAVRDYLTQLMAQLSNEWWEAATVQHEADLLWADPLLTVPGDAQKLATLDRNARWYAWAAVLHSRDAGSIRHAHERAFRYVRVQRAA